MGGRLSLGPVAKPYIPYTLSIGLALRLDPKQDPLCAQGNVVYDTEYCIMDNKFRELVTKHKVREVNVRI